MRLTDDVTVAVLSLAAIVSLSGLSACTRQPPPLVVSALSCTSNSYGWMLAGEVTNRSQNSVIIAPVATLLTAERQPIQAIGSIGSTAHIKLLPGEKAPFIFTFSSTILAGPTATGPDHWRVVRAFHLLRFANVTFQNDLQSSSAFGKRLRTAGSTRVSCPAGPSITQAKAAQFASPLKEVPKFSLPRLYEPGKQLNETIFRGRVALLNVFASWAEVCIDQMPGLEYLRHHGVKIYGLDFDDTRPAAKAWLKRWGDPYEAVAFDNEGEQAAIWGIWGVPETFLIDARGHVVAKFVKVITRKRAEQVVLPFIKRLKSRP